MPRRKLLVALAGLVVVGSGRRCDPWAAFWTGVLRRT
jgi:hypothetical protein